MLCGNSTYMLATDDFPKQSQGGITYLAPSMSFPTDLYLHPLRRPKKLRIEILNRDAHATRTSLISSHAEPAPRRSLVLRHILGWAAHSHCGTYRRGAKCLG